MNLDPAANQPLPRAVDKFLGIPYAVPPIGDRRMRKPLPNKTPWEGDRDASKFGSECFQIENSHSAGSEDCLFLNVYTPSFASREVREAARLPVMVWIHGGAFSWGSADVYDLTALASVHNVAVVTANYRFGILGFFASNASLAEEGTTGNWGMLDQREALIWVREEISRFGGDPERVTLFGESAGAFSVQWHLVTAGSRNLFSRAIIQSGGGDVNWIFPTLGDSTRFYDSLSRQILRCNSSDDLICLRAAPTVRFGIRLSDREGKRAPTWASPLFAPSAFGPTVDAAELLDIPGRLAADPRVAVIIGVNRDEGTLFASQLTKGVRVTADVGGGAMIDPTFPPNIDRPVFKKIFRYFFQREEDQAKVEAWIDATKAAYKQGSAATAGLRALSHFLRDALFHCPTLAWVNSLVANGNSVWLYNYAQDPWPVELKGTRFDYIGLEKMDTALLGVFHSAEIPIVLKLFGQSDLFINQVSMKNPWAMAVYPPFSKPGDVHHKMSDVMSCMWTNFATCGHPENCEQACRSSDQSTEVELPAWSLASTGKYLQLQAAADGSLGRMQDLTDSIPANQKSLEMSALSTCRVWAGLSYDYRNLFADVNADPVPEEVCPYYETDLVPL